MPVYKEYKYIKRLDCAHCHHFDGSKCIHPLPRDETCVFIKEKIFTKKWMFKVNIKGRQFLRRGFQSKKDAKENENKFLLENHFKINSKYPTYQFLIKAYLEYLKKDIKITTWYNVKREVDGFYLFLFEDIPIDKLQYHDVIKAREKIDKYFKSIIKKNKSINFLKRFFHFVKVYYQYEFLEIEKMQSFKDYSYRKTILKKDHVDFDDFKKIYNSCEDPFYRLAFLTLFLYGLRLGELLALSVDAFDFKNHQFEIYKEVNYKTGTGHFILTSPKTNKSKRFYYMPNSYEELIKGHIEENKLKDDEFIFFHRNKHQEPIPEETFRRKANQYCKRFQEGFHFHQLRKSTVTLLHDKGVPIEKIKEYVGHSSSRITKDFYLQISKEKQDVILKILEKTIEDLK